MLAIIQSLKNIALYTEIYLALGVGLIIFTMIIPVSPYVLDILLAISISLSIVLLMLSVMIKSPMELTSFPTVLLISTVLRLSLNLASTRLILNDGHIGSSAAGSVIDAFGKFLAGGNIIIGLIVFLIIIVINFVVITKGATRIAEVSARFILDAIPGKQMAIDADLSAGIINDQEASKRRADIEKESNFYGAMDGASKFVRGDAIAGFIITAVNLIGGIAVGIVQQGLTLTDAMRSYSLLTIGDGLVSQIPALVVSTSAGLLISKISSEGSANSAIFNEVTKNSTALAIAAMIMIALSLMPGIPKLPFIGIAAVLIISYSKLSARHTNAEERTSKSIKQELTYEDELANMLSIDRIKIELGYNILSAVKGIDGEGLDNTSIAKKIKHLRKVFLEDSGILLPSVRITDNISIDKNSYVIRINEIKIDEGSVKPDMVMVISDNDNEPIKIQGEETIEPAFNVKAMWIPYDAIDEAKEYGYTIVEPQSVVITHISEILKRNIKDVFMLTDLQELLEKSSNSIKKLSDEILSAGKVNIYGIHGVMCNLLNEEISIRDIGGILSYIGSGTQFYDSIEDISEFVRYNMQRQITNAVSIDNTVNAIFISDTVEQSLMPLSDPQSSSQGEYAEIGSKLLNKISELIEKIDNTIIPCIVTHHKIRKIVRKITERKFNFIHIIASREISPSVKINVIGNID